MLNFFKKKPKTPDDFVKKFFQDSRKKCCQLELYYKGEIILQVESLKYSSVWMEWANVNKKIFSNGFVVHFFIEKNKLKNNTVYKRYLLKKEKLNMIEFEDTKLNIINFTHFFKPDVDYSEISIYMKELIDSIYSFKEKKPQAFFNIRYMKW